MRRTGAGLVVAGLAIHLALALGALGTVPEPARILLAFAVLVLLPGFAFVALGARPPGGGWLAAGWALGFGVAWNAVLILATVALRVPFTTLVVATLPLHAVLWAIVGRRLRAGGSPVGGPGAGPEAARWPFAARLALVLALALAAWTCARIGATLGYHTDSPDHIATVRRMAASGDAFPADAFYRDAESTADPRKGLWHPQVALVSRLAAADPVAVWRHLPIALAPLFAINVAVLGFLLGGPAAAALAAWALVLTYGGSLAEPYLREAVFSTKLGDQLALAAAAAALADLERPSRSRRGAAALLALGATTTHVYYAIQFALVLPALVVALAISERGLGPRSRRAFGTALAVGVACLPYVAWRASWSYAPSNPIHTEPQGMMIVTDGLRVVPPWLLLDWFGYAWILFPIAAAALWREGRHNPAALYLLSTAVALVLVIFNPLAVRVLEPRLGYLLMRMVWMLPVAPLVAWVAIALARRFREGGRPRRATAALGLAGLALLLAPYVADAWQVAVHPERFVRAEARHSPALWRDELTWMQRSLPPATVVLSDPLTSYAVPMTTGLYVVTLVDQHSSPNDARAIDRILDARDALDPYGTWERTREVVRRYDVGAIVLNDRFLDLPHLVYWAPRPHWFAAARRRLDGEPAAFERVLDHGDFVVYRVHRGALDTLSSPAPPRPFVRAQRPGREPIARRMGEGVPALARFDLGSRAVAPGDTLHAVAEWRALEPHRPGAYDVSVRFDRGLPGGFEPPVWIGKPARKLVEMIHGETYRFRADHVPVGGVYGLDAWRPGEVVQDSFWLEVPRHVADGVYVVRVKMIHQPPFPNFRLSDFFMDDDYYAGVPVTELIVGRTREARVNPRGPRPELGGH